MKNNKKAFIILGAILAAVIICVVVFALLYKQPVQQSAEVPTQTTTVPQTTTAETTTPEETTTIKYAEPHINFEELWAVNPDVYAYIEVPDTPISYPVLRSSDQEDDYYLNVTFEGASGYPGSIYTQQITSPDYSDYISVLYGHDMADGSFFGSVKDYINKDHFNSHRKLFIYTPEKQLEYKVVAQVTINDDNISYIFDTKKKGDAKLFWDYLQNGEEENTFADDYQFRSGDKFVVLATCIGWRPDDRRILVAVLTEELPVK